MTKPVTGPLIDLEVYGKHIGALLVLERLEVWSREAPENKPVYDRLAEDAIDALGLDRALARELPDEPFFFTSLRARVQSEPGCFMNALATLFAAREQRFPELVRSLRLEEYPPNLAAAALW